MAGIYVPPIIGMSSYTIAPVDGSAFARRHANLVCDGTDDQDDINSALADGPVRLCKGTFGVSDSVIVPTLGWLSGDGPGTILRASNDFTVVATYHTVTADMVVVTMCAVVVTDPAGGTSDITIENLLIEGNSAGQATQGHNMAGLLVYDSDYVTLRDIVAQNVLRTGYATDNATRQMCIVLNGCNYGEVWNCRALRAGYEALGLRGCTWTKVHGGLCLADDNAVHVAQSYRATDSAQNNGFYGVTFQRDNFSANLGGLIAHHSGGMRAEGCTFLRCACTFNSTSRGIVNGCHFQEWPSVIVATSGAANLTITGNDFYQAYLGLLITGDGNDNILFRGNMFNGASYFLQFTAAGSDVDNLRIEGNDITAVTSCFKMNGTSTRTLIKNNRIQTGPTYSFNLTDGTHSGLVLEGNDFDGPTNLSYGGLALPSDTIARNNGSKLVTRNRGTATVANGATTAVVTHGLYTTPSMNDIRLTPTNNLGNATKFWVSAVTSTTFTITVDADPGATTATFTWEARCLGD